MIPIEQSIRKGMDKHIFISTKEENYVLKTGTILAVEIIFFVLPREKEGKGKSAYSP